MSRLKSLSSNPTLRNFAQDASQSAIRRVAQFLAPSVDVPDVSGQYKVYDSKHRYKRPQTRRAHDGRATRIGFTADDAWFNLAPNALDFPIANAEKLGENTLLNYAQYGATLLADSSALAHEGEVIDKALAAAGAGTDENFKAANFDPVEYLDEEIQKIIKAAKNGAPVKILFGSTAWLRTKNNASVRNRFVSGGGKKIANPSLEDFSQMLFSNPRCEMSLLVEDTAPEGLAEDIQFLLDDAIFVFASNDQPNTIDPSFMKTFRLMGQWMVPGSYESEDGRDHILKFDWYEDIKVTNPAVVSRINAKAA